MKHFVHLHRAAQHLIGILAKDFAAIAMFGPQQIGPRLRPQHTFIRRYRFAGLGERGCLANSLRSTAATRMCWYSLNLAWTVPEKRGSFDRWRCRRTFITRRRDFSSFEDMPSVTSMPLHSSSQPHAMQEKHARRERMATLATFIVLCSVCAQPCKSCFS